MLFLVLFFLHRMNGMISSVLVAIWVFIPAMVPNSFAALFGGGGPIDFGKTWRGKRILGDGKTWRGLSGGTLGGVVTGLVEIAVSMPFDPKNHWEFGSFQTALIILFLLSFGALLGDIMGSLIKRRLGMKRGQKFPILDQYDFLIGAFLLLLIFDPYWVKSIYIEGNGIFGLLALLFLVPLLHRSVNIIGYRMGVKNEPW